MLRVIRLRLRAPGTPEIPKVDQDDLGLLVAVASLLTRHDEAPAKSALESTLLGAPLRADVAAKRLGELVARVARGALDSLDAVLKVVFAVMPPDFEAELASAVLRGIANDPGDVGSAMVLGRLFERQGRVALARSAYSLAHFVDAGVGTGKRLAELGERISPRPCGMLKDSSAGEETATIAQRQEHLRNSPALRELVAFMMSEEFAALVEGG